MSRESNPGRRFTPLDQTARHAADSDWGLELAHDSPDSWQLSPQSSETTPFKQILFVKKSGESCASSRPQSESAQFRGMLQNSPDFSRLLNDPECSRMLQNAPECSRMLQNAPIMLQNLECSRTKTVIPTTLQNTPECSTLFQNSRISNAPDCSRILPLKTLMLQNAPECS